MDYFIFKGKSSTEFDGLYVTSLPPITKPSMRTEEIKIDGRDGSVIRDLGYSTYKKTIELVKIGDIDIEEIKGWLDGEGKLILSNESDKYYNAKIIDNVDYSRLKLYNKDKITFLIQPFKYPLNEEEISHEVELLNQEGTDLEFNNTEVVKFNSLDLLGNSEQDGTPTADNPVNNNIVTGEQNISIVGKNLLYSNLTYPFTSSGVTVTQEEDGSVTLNGIQTGAMHIIFNNNYYNDIKKYEGETISASITTSGEGSFSNFGIKKETSLDLLVATSPAKSKTAVLDLNGYTDIRFDIYFNNVSRTFVNYNIKPQVEIGNVTDYKTHQGKSYEINLGKNLFNKDNKIVNCFIDNRGIESSNGNYCASDYITIKKYKNISLSGNSYIQSSHGAKCAFYDINKSFISYSDIERGSNTYEVPSNAYYFRTSIRNVDVDKIQIEVGICVTDYASYFEPIKLCKLGTYQDKIYYQNSKWYLHKEIDMAVVNSLNDGASYAVDTSSTDTTRVSISQCLNGQATYNPTIARTVSLCNYFNYYANWSTDKVGFFVDSDENLTKNGLVFRGLKTDIGTTPSEVENWLNNNPLEIYYVLANPTDIEITSLNYPTLYTQLKQIENATSYDEKTYISVENDEENLVLNLSVSVYEKKEFTINNIGNVVSKPTMTIYGSSDISVYLNNIQIFNIALGDEEYITINVDNMEAYKDDVLKNRLVTGNYDNFVLNPGENTLYFSGDVTKVEISNYSRWL